MNRYKIEGGQKLSGSIDVQGAKNAALPILTATIINSGKSVIHNCPDLSDIQSTIEILEMLGCCVERNGTDVTVDSSQLRFCSIPSCAMSKTRSSVVFAGALVSRCKRAAIASSGGCSIGCRPIDIHLEAFETMGMQISKHGEFLICDAKNVKPGTVILKFPSVGATENVMLAASLLKGCTTIINAAKEPEISNLADYLRSIGVSVTGDGSSVIKVRGTQNPTDGEVSVIPDRIVASTYIAASLVTNGEVLLKNVKPSHLSPVLAAFRKMGAHIELKSDTIKVFPSGKLVNIPYISTAPYPGFPTDAQPLLVSVMALSQGQAIMRESIFENRFGHCSRLCRMGADIQIYRGFACVKGVGKLFSANIDACDLRCGASLCVAALAACGTSYISDIHYIDRGYENLCRDLAMLGAKAERID